MISFTQQNIEEYSLRVGQQAVVVVATPGKSSTAPNAFRAYGAKPLEDVVKNLRSVILAELETALSRQAPAPHFDDPSRQELPPLVVDGIPTPVEKMTQAQLRAFIPLMLKYSTGRGKPGWGKETTRPPRPARSRPSKTRKNNKNNPAAERAWAICSRRYPQAKISKSNKNS